MIWICALNPSLDYHMTVSDLQVGETNRSLSEHVVIGGKGINVAIVLNRLQVSATLVGFFGGFTGAKIVGALSQYPYILDGLTRLESDTRINVKIKGCVETEINGKGQKVSRLDLQAIEQKLRSANTGDCVVLTGSVANGMDYSWYSDMARELSSRGVDIVVDIADAALLDILPYKPLLVKPNVHELESILGRELIGDASIIEAGKVCVAMGAQACIVSNGAKGSFLVTSDAVYTANVPKGKTINTIGAGDSMVGGYLMGVKTGKSIETSYRYGVACASATAYSEHIGTVSEIESMLKEVHISRIGGTK